MQEGTYRAATFILFQVMELVVFCVAFIAGMLALENAGIIVLANYIHPIFFGIFFVLALLWNRLLTAMDLYVSRRMIKRNNEYLMLVGAVVLAAAFLALLGALLGQPINAAPFLIWFMLISMSLLIPGRFAGRLLLKAIRAYGRNLRFVAIVGAGSEGQALARDILANPKFGFRIRGLFDSDEIRRKLPSDLNFGGTIGQLSQILMREPVDEVVIALPMDTRFDDIGDVLKMCARTGVSARVVGDLIGKFGPGIPEVEMIGSDACLHFNAVPNWGWGGQAKRAFDLVGSGLGLLAILPLLIVVAILIKLESKGPAFFVQTRVGKNRRHFNLYKFRTMVQDAEALQADLESANEAGGPVFKIKSDPRVTHLGHLLRKYSIDELPQLINVIKGDMSLVGPRPLPLRDVERFEHDWHSRRFSVRPGLTCSWVLKGRSEMEFDAWVRTDLDYIDNWSLSKDIEICLRTIPAVLRGAGAY